LEDQLTGNGTKPRLHLKGDEAGTVEIARTDGEITSSSEVRTLPVCAPRLLSKPAESGSLSGESVRHDCICPIHKQTRAIRVDKSQALGPHGSDKLQPAFQFFPELTGPGVICAAELIGQAEVSEQRHTLLSMGGETAIGEPHKQIERGWTGRKCFGSLQVCRKGMTGDLSIKIIAQNDRIPAVFGQQSLVGISRVPDACFGHEVEACAVNNPLSAGTVSLPAACQKRQASRPHCRM
jgi:hypothetical protein